MVIKPQSSGQQTKIIPKIYNPIYCCRNRLDFFYLFIGLLCFKFIEANIIKNLNILRFKLKILILFFLDKNYLK